MSQSIPLAIIGFGEVGKLFSRQFIERGDVTIAVYDILFSDPEKGPPMLAAAKEIGVRAASSPVDAAKDARVVISAVTASRAGRTRAYSSVLAWTTGRSRSSRVSHALTIVLSQFLPA